VTAVAFRFKSVIPVVLVDDVEAALRYYTEKLGFQITFTTPWNYAGVGRDGLELHIGKGDGQRPYNRGANIYFMVEGLDALADDLRERGAITTEQIIEQVYGLRELHVIDPFGYHLAFAEPLQKQEN
jgi:uncharacterized glyoxalase superfamily protein PhnB